MCKKIIFKIVLLTLGLCLTAGYINNGNNDESTQTEKQDNQESVSNNAETIKENNAKSDDVKEDNKEASKYDIFTKNYKKP